ncbi:hypothetical protein Ancab_005997 [Ancistrocladus abbreviatus]
MYAERLAELAVALGFDGWLLNFEVKLDGDQIPNLIEFVRHLTQTMHASKPDSLVIWYDSVTNSGRLRWQNQLNDSNKPFFDSCDGIFVNYFWMTDYPMRSAEVAGERRFDVYMGIDVFGRNTYGGGKWNTHIALDVLKKDSVSAAIFAPGWVYETKQPPDFPTAQNRWWALVEKSWGVMQQYPRSLPFYSNFDQGHGYQFYVHGGLVSNTAWNNISCQSFQPFLEYFGDSESNTIQAHVNFKEASYSGGSSIAFSGDLTNMEHFMERLFEGELLISNLPVQFLCSVKLGSNSFIGLSLEFSSSTNERKEVLLASRGNALLTMNQFSSKFSAVIMPCQVTELETTKGWVIEEYNINMEAHRLTTIHAVCYKWKPEVDEPKINAASNYYATLGHLTIKTLGQSVVFPPSTSWVVGGQFINWKPGTQGSKFVSLKITWKLKDENDSLLPKYIIYVEKIGGKVDMTATGKLEYLGVASVQAFYVSQLPVPSGTSSLKFIIQVCGVDGSNQNVDECPSYQLVVD